MSVGDWIALASFAGVIVGALIMHMVADAKLAERVRRLEQEVGTDTHDGLRGDRHKVNNRLATHKAILYFLCKQNGINGDLIQSLEKD